MGVLAGHFFVIYPMTNTHKAMRINKIQSFFHILFISTIKQCLINYILITYSKQLHFIFVLYSFYYHFKMEMIWI